MSLSPDEAPAHQAADREILIQMITGSLVASQFPRAGVFVPSQDAVPSEQKQ